PHGGRPATGIDPAVARMQLQFERQILPSLPCVPRQQRCAGGKIDQRGGISRRRLCALPSRQVQLSELFALVVRSDQRRATVELVDDLENSLVAFFWWCLRSQQATDS